MASQDCLSNSGWKEQAYRLTGKNLPAPIYEQQTFKDPNFNNQEVSVKLWSHLSDILVSQVLERGKKLSTGLPNPNWNVAYQTQIGLQRRLNTTSFYAMYFFARWDKRTVSTTGGDVPIRTWPIDAAYWDLFTPTGGDKTDFDSHVCMFNVFNALGRIANSKNDAQQASEPTSPTPTPATYVASFIVYMAHIVALATATEAKRPMTDGNPVVYTFDVYASLLWCCRKIKERTYLGIKPFTANELFEILRQEWRQDKPYEKDETSAILWAAFINDANSANDYIAHGVKEMNKNIPMPGGKKTSSFQSSGSTPAATIAEQQARIEAFFEEFLSYSVGLKSWTDGPDWGNDRCTFTVPMSLAVFPLTPGIVNDKLKTTMAKGAWDNSLDDFMKTAKDDLDKFMGTGACKPGEYFSKKRNACTPIPVCPQTGDDPKRTKFDETTEECVEPSSGGGGGGGSGSPLLLLLLLLLALAYVSSRSR
jgi:hypothetical protein